MLIVSACFSHEVAYQYEQSQAVIALCSFRMQWHTCVFNSKHELILILMMVLFSLKMCFISNDGDAFMRRGIRTDMGYLFRHLHCESCRRAVVWTELYEPQTSDAVISAVMFMLVRLSWDKSEQDTALSLGCSVALHLPKEMFPNRLILARSNVSQWPNVSKALCQEKLQHNSFMTAKHTTAESTRHTHTQQKKYNPSFISTNIIYIYC